MGACFGKRKEVIEAPFYQKRGAMMLRTHSSTILKEINKDFDLGNVLGTGHFGVVRKANYKDNPSYFVAIKTIEKSKVNKLMDQLQKEIDILRELDHPNIIKLYDVYEDSKFINLVLEFCQGGELFDRIVEIGCYSESDAAILMKQILSAVYNLHLRGICHRDIKPENFMFYDSSNLSDLKMIDFGLSSKFAQSEGSLQRMSSMVGTPYYVAPEVLNGSYDQKCDLWSVGVLMYALLSGALPFPGQSQQEIYANITHGRIKMRGSRWERVSREAKDLISRLLVKNPKNRLDAEQALAHKWFEKATKTKIIEVDPSIIHSLRSFKAKTKLQAAALSMIVKYSSVQDLKDLKQAFLQFDTSNTGFLSLDELKHALEQSGITVPQEEIEIIFKNADVMGDGRINYSEFIAATMQSRIQIDKQMIWTIFKKFDVDNSGSITLENLQEVFRRLGQNYSDDQLKEMIAEVDLAKDGRISIEEFQVMMSATQ